MVRRILLQCVKVDGFFFRSSISNYLSTFFVLVHSKNKCRDEVPSRGSDKKVDVSVYEDSDKSKEVDLLSAGLQCLWNGPLRGH